MRATRAHVAADPILRIRGARDHDAVRGNERGHRLTVAQALDAGERHPAEQVHAHRDRAGEAPVVGKYRLHRRHRPALVDAPDQRPRQPEARLGDHLLAQIIVRDAQHAVARRRDGATQDAAFEIDDQDVDGARIQLLQFRQRRIAVARVHRPDQRPPRHCFERGADRFHVALRAVGDGRRDLRTAVAECSRSRCAES
jgi:hypothetical protein